MQYYLGLDIHSASFTLACLTKEGSLVKCLTRPTSAHELIEAVTSFKGKRSLVVEECHMAGWTLRVLKSYCDELVICDPKHNKWIYKADHASDKSDAIKLAKLLLGGFIKAVRHAEGHKADLRALFLHYYDLTRECSRIKFKLKAEFRMLAIKASGTGIYKETNRLEWLGKLKDETATKIQAEHYYQLIDNLEALRKKTMQIITRESKKDPAYPILDGFPGIGSTLASGYLAIIDTPERFSRKNKLWSYAGFGVRHLESDGCVQTQSSKQGNRVLKWIVSENFRGAMRTLKKNKFQRRFESLSTKGFNAKQARRVVCRDILSSVRACWIKKEAYKDLI